MPLLLRGHRCVSPPHHCFFIHLVYNPLEGLATCWLKTSTVHTVGFAGAIWILTRGVQVVKVCKDVFSFFESFVGCHQTGVFGKAQQKEHPPVRRPLTLLDVANLTSLILPWENRRLAVESPHKRQQAPIRPRSIEFLDMRSKTSTPSTNAMVHLGLDCASVSKMCETHSMSWSSTRVGTVQLHPRPPWTLVEPWSSPLLAPRSH